MASRFWVGGTGTWDSTTTTNWSATTGGAGGASVPASGDTVTFDGSSGAGTVTVGATINGTNTVVSITMGAFTGTLDFSANNPDVNLATFNGSGTGTRTLNMGNGTWTLTAAVGGSTWDFTTTTSLTFAANSSTLRFTGNGGLTFPTGGKTFNAVSFGAVTNGQVTVITGSPTFATMSITAPRNFQIASGATVTVSAAPTWAASSGSFITFYGQNIVAGSTLAFTAGTPSLTWTALRAITVTGTMGTATNSFDLGGNSGITITAPSGGGPTYGRVIGG